MPEPETRDKHRVTVTIDQDIADAVTDTAKAQRLTFSGMVNQMLGIMTGKIGAASLRADTEES